MRFGRKGGIAHGYLHREPVDQRGEDRGHVVAVDLHELAEVLARANDFGDLIAPAVIEPLTGSGRAPITKRPFPELHPQGHVVLGGVSLDQQAELVARVVEPREALGNGAMEAVLVEGERVGSSSSFDPNQ